MRLTWSAIETIIGNTNPVLYEASSPVSFYGVLTP